MTIHVKREGFLQILESLQAGLSPREIVEQSTCFVFKEGEAVSYNGEVSCRSPSGLPPELTGAVVADKLLEVLRRMPEDEVEIEQREGELLVTGKRRQAGIRMEKDITLRTQEVEKPKKWNRLPNEFAEAAGIVGQCAGSDETQFLLTCVHLHPKWLEATDNNQLIRWRLALPLKGACLLRKDAVKEVAKLGMEQVAETEGWLHFKRKGDLVLSCRRYVEEFADLSPHMEVDGSPVSLPKGLAEAAEKAAIFSQENPEANMVLIHLKPGKLAVKGQGVNGWYRESRKIAYTGPALEFLIAPDLLKNLVDKYAEVHVAPERLKVDGGSFTYVTCLSLPAGTPEPEEKPMRRKKTRVATED